MHNEKGLLFIGRGWLIMQRKLRSQQQRVVSSFHCRKADVTQISLKREKVTLLFV
jgi:hypothetical protein